MYKPSEKEQTDGIKNVHASAISVKMNTMKMAPQIIGFSKDSNTGNNGANNISTILLDMKTFGK